jgi:predicted outer membrane repeat protein
MPAHAGVTGAAVHRGRSALARAALALGVLAVAAAGTVAAGAGPAAAAPAVLYAAAAAAGTGDCSAAADACTLTTALTDAQPGGTIELVTPGGTAHYVGNWTVGTPGTSATAPVTIAAAPGLASQPVLDGNNGNSTGCSTASCNGPVLTVPANEYVALSAVTIANGNNTTTGFGGGGLDNAGTVTITGSTFTGNTASDGGAIDSGDFGGGSVTVTASTFTGNTAGDGGAIDSGDVEGGGTVTVTASTFTGNTALHGGAIDGGDGGGGSVTVTASAFSGNTATVDGGAIDGGDSGGGLVTVTGSTFTGNTAGFDGGAIDSGGAGSGKPGGGSVTVTASTFTGNTAGNGGAIDSGGEAVNTGGGSLTVTASTFTTNTATRNGDTIAGGVFGGAGTVQVAGDLFDGSCYQGPGGTWTDGGYNAGTDTSCFAATPPASDTSGTAVHTDLQTGLTGNGGPTQTIEPTTGNPAIGLMATIPTTVTLGGSQVTLCPATDQRGYSETPGGRCDAGAVQTTGAPPLTLADAAAPGSFSAAGQVITYSDRVTNFGAGTLTGITVTDPAVPGLSCPASSLPPGFSETCTGAYTTTAADVAAGKVTDTATGTATTATGVPVTSAPSTVTVARGWPPAVAGTYKPAAHAAEGYYLGVTTNTWQLLVTHPGTTKVAFTGRITVPAGALGHLSLISRATGHQVTLTGRVLTFTLPDSGKVTGFRFTTSKAPSITLTLNIAGHPATTSQLFLGGTAAHPASGSPLTFTW